MVVDKEVILEALKQVYDPEIPVDVVNLGLVYEVKIDGARVEIRMTTTAPGCPVADYIAAQAKRVVGKLEGVGEVDVEMVYEPPWSMDRVTKEGREMLWWR